MALHDIDLNLPIVDLRTGLATDQFKEWIRINKKDKANRVEDATADNIATLTSEGHPQDGNKSLPSGDFVGLTDEQQLSNKTFAELITTKILASNGSGGLQEIDLSDWVSGTEGKITITDDGDGTITLNISLKANSGLTFDANGIYLLLRSGYGITVDSNGLQLKQQSNIADASAISSISAGSGSDSIDLSTFNTDLGTLVTQINAIKDKVNSILDLILATELMAAP